MNGVLAKPGFVLLCRLAFWLALAFTLYMALTPHPPAIAPPSLWDKWQHMGAFATLSLLSGLGYRRMPLLLLAEHLSFLGAMIEVVQAMPIISRDCDIFDWVADTIAIIVALFIVSHLRKMAASGS